jgi:hypothetical protein
MAFSSGRGRISEEGEGEWIWSTYFVYEYGNRIMKPVEIVLRWGGPGIREKDGGGESNQDTL